MGFPVCHDDATCNNVVGSFSCSCNTGFYSNGSNCQSKSDVTVICHFIRRFTFIGGPCTDQGEYLCVCITHWSVFYPLYVVHLFMSRIRRNT